jgi:nodulation protein E
MTRVVVTGRGVVSAIGNSVADFGDSLCKGRPGIHPLCEMPTEELQTAVGAQVRGFDAAAHFQKSELALLDRAAQFALLATRNAVKESGVAFGGGLGERTAAIVGTGAANVHSVEECYLGMFSEKRRRAPPLTVPRLMMNAAVGHITIEHGVTGPSFMVANACSSSACAIALAFQMVRHGLVDAALCGGTEACLTPGCIRGWEALRVMAPDTCRPFSKGRRGLVLGEGAAMFVLETLDGARKRGAPIFGEIVGAAQNSDAMHILSPSLEGQTAALRACLRDAQLNEEDVDYINAHGTGTAANDVTETQAIRHTFHGHSDNLLISSTKAMHGHTLGGAGAIELLASLIALEKGFVPPTINFTEPDPDCDLNYVPNDAREARCDVALSNSFAFGGHNAVLAVCARHLI